LELSVNVAGCLEYVWMFKLNEINWFGNLAVWLLIFLGLLVCVLGF
jgi:hypothetical protein